MRKPIDDSPVQKNAKLQNAHSDNLRGGGIQCICLLLDIIGGSLLDIVIIVLDGLFGNIRCICFGPMCCMSMNVRIGVMSMGI